MFINSNQSDKDSSSKGEKEISDFTKTTDLTKKSGNVILTATAQFGGLLKDLLQLSPVSINCRSSQRDINPELVYESKAPTPSQMMFNPSINHIASVDSDATGHTQSQSHS